MRTFLSFLSFLGLSLLLTLPACIESETDPEPLEGVFFGDGNGSGTTSALSVVTTSATTDTHDRIQVSGRLQGWGNNTTIEVGFCYGTSPNPTFSDDRLKIADLSRKGRPFDMNGEITDLIGATDYYVRAYAKGLPSGTVTYGREIKVRTKNSPIEAVKVRYDGVQDITTSGFKVSASLTSIAGNNSATVGVAVSKTNANPTTEDAKRQITVSSTFNFRTFQITGLEENTTYYVRVFGYGSGNRQVQYTATRQIRTERSSSGGFQPDVYSEVNSSNRTDLYRQNFNSQPNWNSLGETSDYRFTVQNGYFHCQSKSNTYWLYGLTPTSSDAYLQGDYEVEYRAKFISGREDYGFGIRWARFWDNSTMRSFFFSISATQQYCLGRYYGGNDYRFWIDWRSANAINRTDWNKITVRRYDQVFYLFINERFVDAYPTSASPFGSQIAFPAPPQSTVYYDDVRISQF